jgi:pimeloyl-ACP methyl ester carboxylesterase
MAARHGVTWRLLAGGVAALALATAAAVVLVGWAPPEWGATAIVRPWRRPLTGEPELPFRRVRFESAGATLEGWWFAAQPERGTVVYLHGIADNRQSGTGAARRLVPRGYSVLAFDARAHGRSGGDACTYGYHERHDVSRALDTLGARRAVLIGHSLGASVALQAAAVDPRVQGVVAASAFSDLRTIVEERARWFHLPPRYVSAALARAGELGRFPPEQASPLALAPDIRVPVLLLHGEADAKTPAAHSRRIAGALAGPRELLVLPGVGHDEILGRAEAWQAIEAFLERLLPASSVPAPRPAAVPAAAVLDETSPGE